MDASNHADVVDHAPTVEQAQQVRMFREFDPEAADADVDVPDPYYGGDDGFADGPRDDRAYDRRARRAGCPTSWTAERTVRPRGNVVVMARMAGTAARAEALLGIGVVSTTPVAGGDICTSTRLRLTDGRGAIIKTRPHPPEGFFEREAEGLRWLREAGGAHVPHVLAVADDCLVLDWIEPGKPTTDVAERFGRALAATHQAGAERVRRPRRRIRRARAAAQPLAADLAGVLRVPQGHALRRAAVDRQALTAEEAATIEAAMRRIHDFAGPEEPPARIHGDLWSGNIVWGSDGNVWLIDPAAHGGHRETDLAMLSLFGMPHLQRVLDAYDEAAPLADGWKDRVGAAPAAPAAGARDAVRRDVRRAGGSSGAGPARRQGRVASAKSQGSGAD